VRVEEHTIELAGAPVFYRRAPSSGGGVPVYLHGAPTSSDDWVQALERTGGLAPDLLGFGRSAKGGHLHYSPESLADFVEDLLSELEIERLQLVAHGWGTAPATLLAARHPDRVERLVLCNPVPLLPGLSWPWWARLYATRGLGELAIGATTRTMVGRWLVAGSTNSKLLSGARLGPVWEQFDQGTQRAVLRLQRSVDDEREQAMATTLESLRLPVMIIWGDRDPWYPPAVLDAYRARLPEARVERLPEAGHWPWLDDPSAIDRVADFLQAN
jgi:pimeloyl-ACP methyl ester carboxylesterase